MQTSFINAFFLVAAISFFVFPLLGSRTRAPRAPWVRWLFFAVGASVLILAFCGFASDVGISLPISSWRLWGYLSAVRGFIMGLLFALIVSGEFFGKKLPNNAGI